jgi:hypothetical protein
MDDKTNLYVFEKKEVFLIFVFMILIAVTSFVLGVKVGRDFTYPDVKKLTETESADVRLRSDMEESIEEIMERGVQDLSPDYTGRLRETLESELKQEQRALEIEPPTPSGETRGVQSSRDQLRGKFTIQLSAFPSLQEAQRFADGFTVRGYNPIIWEVELPSGIWYRVSIGVYETESEARMFVRQNSELLEGLSEYYFTRF